MEERDQQRQAIDASPGASGRPRAGVGRARDGLERGRLLVEDAAWFLREKVLWPARDGVDEAGERVHDGFVGLGTRGRIGVFGGGAVALGAIVAAIAIGTGGSGSGGGTTEALIVRKAAVTKAAVAPTAKPKKKASSKPSGPTLHGAAPDFSAAKDVKAGVGPGKAVGEEPASGSSDDEAPAARGSSAGAGDAPASSAKIGSTPQASASAQTQEETLSKKSSGVGLAENETNGEGDSAVSGPAAPKAAKQTARRFAEAFVLYEVGGVEGKVRRAFHHTSTKQLSRALLRRPPRQPADVKVPQAKVVNVVASPSHDGVYPVSVSLLRVGVTSELRLQLEQGADGRWQVTDVLG
ncbi:MAG: hypothetical protein QM729_20210 [Solirubrobacterales bacterium]